MNIGLSRSFQKKLKHRIERFEFQVGVLEDKPHKDPKEHGLFDNPELGSYAGGPVRNAGSKAGPLTTGEVLVANMDRLGINLLQDPFQKKDSNLLKFTNAFLKLACEVPGVSMRRVENLLQAVVRNPILKQQYGSNSSVTAELKGFDRHLIDTAQMFKAIKAKGSKK